MNLSMAWRTWAGEVKLAPRRALRDRIENHTSTMFIQLAWVGVKCKCTLVACSPPTGPLDMLVSVLW